MIIDPKMYIKANASTCVHNCLCFFLWENRSFHASIEKIKDYERKYHFCNPDNMEIAILEILQTITTEKGVKKFINEIKKEYVSPSYKTVQSFIDEVYETEGLTAEKIANIVESQLQEMR